MFKRLSYDEFTALAKQHRKIAVYKEIPGDRLTPTNAFMALKNSAKDVSLLESNPKEMHLCRYSHLCFDPIATIEARGHNITIGENNEITHLSAEPFTLLREFKTRHHCYVAHPLSGFAGGMVGFISYDGIRLIENIPDNNANIDDIPDLLFRFYRNHITFDHQTGRVIVSTNITVSDNIQNSYETAMADIDRICDQLGAHQNNAETLLGGEYNNASIQVDVSDNDFKTMVNKAKSHIREGDIFQVVLSRKFSVNVTADAFDIYRALRFSNPSPYMFYIETKDYAITGASPEKLVSISDNTIESCPLAGTRPRSGDNDEAVAAELLADEKENAEHMMLVDLARNDLGRIAQPGTVNVTKLREIEKYTRVMHISSTVQAKLHQEKDVFDAIIASFPAGTLSGAPKIRAMEIIDQLESSKRGIYGGVICAIDSLDNLVSCIAIRTAFIKDGVACVQAGAGVVHDSDPQSEADETYHKANAILEGILAAQGEQS